MNTEENKQHMSHFTEEVINRKNLGAFDQLVSEDFIEQSPLPGQGPGKKGLKFAIGSMHTGFPHMN